MTRTTARKIRVTYVVQKEDGQYAAYCRELGTASCGRTVEEAFTNLHEAIWVHLNAIDEAGERDRWFEERGIQVLAAGDEPEEITLHIQLPRGAFATTDDVLIPAN
jgi:predicted RNase H-like HicB family nuclease